MAEVGANGPAMHAEVGAYARERGIEQLLTFGPAARNSADAFGAGAQAYDSIDALVAGLRSCAPAHILVKGSRSTRMERVVQAIRQQSDAQEQEARHAT
jgi:murE/murF fusion protein